MTLATFIQQSQVEHTVPKAPVKLYSIELRARNSNTFHALYEKITQTFPKINSLLAGVNSDPIEDKNRGLALFCSKNKADLQAIASYTEKLIDDAKKQAMKALPTTGALQAAITIRDFDSAYVDRMCEIIAFTPELLTRRVKEMNNEGSRDCGYDARHAKVAAELAKESCTLAREVGYIVDAIDGAYDGVDKKALQNILQEVADETNALYAQNNVFESSPAQDERFAFSDVIDTLGVDSSTDNETRQTLIIMRMESKTIDDRRRQTVVRDHWETTRKTVRMALKKAMPTLARKGLVKALEDYRNDIRVSDEPITFEGVSIEQTLTPPMHSRLSLRNLAYDKTEQGNTPINVLSGAIVAQIGAFTEMKKTALLQQRLHAQADALMQQGSFTKLEGYNALSRVITETASATV